MGVAYAVVDICAVGGGGCVKSMMVGIVCILDD